MIASRSEIRAALGLASSITDVESSILTLIHPSVEASVRKHLRYNPEQSEITEYYPIADLQDRVVESNVQRRYTSNSTHAVLDTIDRIGADQLQINRVPIRSVGSLYEDLDARAGTAANAFASSTELTEGTDFYPDYDAPGICRSGIIIRQAGSWPATPGSIKITYTAGYTAAELGGDFSGANAIDALPIKTAVLQTAVLAFTQMVQLQKKASVGFTSGPITGEKLGDYSYTTDSSLAKIFTGLQVDIPLSARGELNEFVFMGQP